MIRLDEHQRPLPLIAAILLERRLVIRPPERFEWRHDEVVPCTCLEPELGRVRRRIQSADRVLKRRLLWRPVAVDHQVLKPRHLDQVRLALRSEQLLVLFLDVDLARHRFLAYFSLPVPASGVVPRGWRAGHQQ